MKDHESLVASEENKYSKSNSEDGHGLQLSLGQEVTPQVTEVPVPLDSDAIQVERPGRSTSQVEVNFATRPLDLNIEDYSSTYSPCKESKRITRNIGKVTPRGILYRGHQSECVSSRGTGVDLNVEDVSSSMNTVLFNPSKDGTIFKSGDISECGSSASPLKGKDPLEVWKKMKQNGYMSSFHSSITLPKQCERKSKRDLQKKRIEIAKKEQVSRFTKLAAPSGLLNELNPGIINHVRNRKQVHTIIEALVKSEKHENQNAGSKQANRLTSDALDVWKCKDLEHSNNMALSQQNFLHEKNFSLYPGSRQEREYLWPKIDTPLFSGIKVSDGEQYMAERTSLKGCTSLCTDVEDTLTLKLSSSIKASESSSSVSNEDSSSFTGVSSLSVKAATVASQWLELLSQDIKGRLSALQRSKKRVHAVISTELPFLAVKEFSSNKENNPCVTKNSAGLFNKSNADIHQKQWSMLFEQMDVSLSKEEEELESWLEQVQQMLALSNQGLQHIHGERNYGVQQQELVENNSSDQIMESSDKELAVRAAAASIYSTCSLISSENLNH